jgi:hypothetical protein
MGALFSLLDAAGASAAVVTVGSPLTGPFETNEFEEALTVANQLPGVTAVASPVSGLVVGWNLQAAHDGPFALRVIHPNGDGTYTGAGTSSPVLPTSLGRLHFPAAIPIKSGDLVGLDVADEGDIGIRELTAPAGVVFWNPPLADGEAKAPSPSDPKETAEFSFNAEVLPAPTVTGVKPKTGSFKGGSKLTISGTDFTQVSAVTIGGVSAKSFSVSSEGTISAVAPAERLGAAPVAVTTAAGTSSATTAASLTYIACVVPSLTGKKPARARNALRSHHCAVGKVHRRVRTKARTTKVVAQSAKAGRKLAPGAKVSLTLG